VSGEPRPEKDFFGTFLVSKKYELKSGRGAKMKQPGNLDLVICLEFDPDCNRDGICDFYVSSLSPPGNDME